MNSVKSTPSFDTRSIRVSILGSYWLAVLLALPLWWFTTNIERLSLPGVSLDQSSSRNIFFPVRVTLDNAHFSASFASDVQTLLRNKIVSDPDGASIIAPYVESSTLTRLEENEYYVTTKHSDRLSELQSRQLRVATSPGRLPTAANIAQNLFSLLSSPATTASSNHMVAKFSPRYRLAFSLLNEDAAAGKAAADWDITSSVIEFIQPTLNQLCDLHNFTIESQLRFHAPLAFDPLSIAHTNGERHGLTQEQLTVFVNSADWSLSSSVSEDPVLHFLLFIPSASRRPLEILDAAYNPTMSHSFVVPQWGGVVIYNPPENVSDHFPLAASDLSTPFNIFRDHLLALLGVPALPANIVNDDSQDMSDWQLDALVRRRAREAADSSKETLASIYKLVNQIENMPVGPNVRDDVQNALHEIRHLDDVPQARAVLKRASRAFELSSKAFFNPGMLAMLYFPAEHKYAVYSPFFLPVTMFLVLGAAREFKDWRRTRRTGTP